MRGWKTYRFTLPYMGGLAHIRVVGQIQFTKNIQKNNRRTFFLAQRDSHKHTHTFSFGARDLDATGILHKIELKF